MEERSIVIVGGGPAGLTAGIYAARVGLRPLLIERGALGGKVRFTERLENFPGFSMGVEGHRLIAEMEGQARRFGVEFTTADIFEVKPIDEHLEVVGNGLRIRAEAVIVATGTGPRPLGVPGEERLRGKGVSYCALSDASLFRHREVAVVGGGDSAVKEALFLARYADRVYVIHRRDTLRAAQVLQEAAMAEPKITFVWDSVVTEVLGSDWVEGVKVKNLKTGEEDCLEVSGLVVFIGNQPNSGLVGQIVELDPHGFILTNEEMRTSHPRILAAGDVRRKRLRDAVTAVADGALAATVAHGIIRHR
ncbi:NAD(P)/FAD-dependent oxidoreductase [Ammonifex thiophilus]|uniref:Thioredoxin-disulfide reductase n=1 Tax=Ammonifex thiophilus TaxID=444093 RepID=A0A3D8P4R8_9THEO|nr:FAD-dependent oxidoreductase [Ammonifex thiophilus]RDV84230.1 thioredoxin-disulfide reductase [Ammonifex thiophilus]